MHSLQQGLLLWSIKDGYTNPRRPKEAINKNQESKWGLSLKTVALLKAFTLVSLCSPEDIISLFPQN